MICHTNYSDAYHACGGTPTPCWYSCAFESGTFEVSRVMPAEKFCVTQDMILVREDGSMAVVKRGTIISIPAMCVTDLRND